MRTRAYGVGAALAALLALAPGAALAGPPFKTDDPIPTDTGHWELYGPLIEASGTRSAFEGSAGVEINYGAAPNVQLTLGVPAAFAHDETGTSWGRGDLELSAKYRFYNDEASGFSAAVFPGLTLPTASGDLGSPNATVFLPVWAQKDAGPWSVFGGGGYTINPGRENRDYWSGGIAVSREVSERLLLGAEIDRQGADTVGGRATTELGVDMIVQLEGPFRLLASAGPSFTEGDGSPALHAFLALGADF
ncbi:transporter [Caulobacter sp. 17J80-11]|uniref:transporter n=1 Tax=Caulobacter sp. 17J80-11 TaxID=2763502 RepID=UPI0016535FD7|nr:transporter [Caulobacter sp. 17J80-11]